MTSFLFVRVLQAFMVPNHKLDQMGLPRIRINHLFFAMTFFIQKFDDQTLVEYLFQLFLGESVDKELTRLEQARVGDPRFYCFEYTNQDIIGESDQTRATRSISVSSCVSTAKCSLGRSCPSISSSPPKSAFLEATGKRPFRPMRVFDASMRTTLIVWAPFLRSCFSRKERPRPTWSRLYCSVSRLPKSPRVSTRSRIFSPSSSE